MSLERAFEGAERAATTESIAKFLHDLAQPITALECSADVALLRRRTSEEYAETIADHKALICQIRGLMERYREAFESGRP